MQGCKSIWILNHYAITPDLPGGTRHFDFAKELTKRGYSITIFASAFIHGIFEYRKLNKKEKWRVENYDGVNFVWIKTFPYKGNGVRRILNMLSYFISVEQIGKLSAKGSSVPFKVPDIIIGSSVHPFAALAGYKLSRFYKTPFVFEVRDLWPQTLIELGKISSKNPFVVVLRKLEKYLYKKSDRIIVLLPKASDYIKSLGILREKIVWIPNGVDIRRFSDAKKYINSRNNKFIVSYVGSHGVANSLGTLIEAAKILQDKGYKDILVRLVGSGAEKERLIRKAQILNLKNVIFENPVSKNNVPTVLLDSDVLYAGLSNKDGLYRFGISLNKLFDYLAAEKPIIFASNAFNNPIEESSAGISVAPEDPQSVANAIIKLYNMSEEERKQMGKNGKEYVENKHGIPILVNRLENLFNELCENYKAAV